VFNTLPWAVSAILGLVFTPYIVHGFGAEAYGVLSVVLAIVGYLSFLDLNLGSAVVKYVAEYQGQGCVAKVNDVIGTTVFLFLIIGVTGGVALLLLADTIFIQLLKIDPNLVPTVRSMISIGAIGFLVTLLLSAATGVVHGLNRFDITGRVTIVSSILISLGTVLAVKFKFGIASVVVLNVVVELCGIGALIFVAKRVLPGLSVKPLLRGNMRKKILRFGGYTFLSRLASLITFQGDRILAGVLLGSSAVTFYVVPVMLTQKFMGAVWRLAAVTFPLASELQGKNDLDHIKDLYLNASRIIVAFATAAALPMLIFGKNFLSAWMGSEFERNTGLVLQLATVALYLDTMSQVPSLVLNGLGHVRITGLFSVAGAGLNFAVILLLSSIMGVSGIAASLLLSEIVTVPIFLTYVHHKIIGLPIVGLLKEVYARPLILAVVVGAAALALPLDSSGNIFLTIGAMALTGVTYLALAISAGVFNRDERQVVISYLRTLMRTN
jgi:O-antigen/teichoic acid export membrane protein